MYSTTVAVGRLTKDPQIKAYSSGQGELALFSLAVNYAKDKTAYYDCVSFGKTAEMVKNYLANGKGRLILVEGMFQNNNTEKEIAGQKVTNYGMNFVVHRIQFLDAPTKTDNKPAQSQYGQQKQPQYGQSQQGYSAPQQSQPQKDPFQQAPGGFSGFNIGDDDVPF